MKEFLYCWRSVYGVPKAYPASPIAEKFAVLLGQRTFERHQLNNIHRLAAELGFTVACAPDPKMQLQVPA